jgi:type I restriction enzyme S subunit
MTNAQQNWSLAPLIELLSTLETGGRPKGGVRDIADGVPSLGGEHLSYGGKFKFEKLKFIPEEFAASLNSGKLSVDDVLIVKDGATTGKTVRVGNDFPFEVAYVNEHVYLCRPLRNINSHFLTYFLRSDDGQKAILNNFRGAAQGGITRAFADNLFVPLAPLNEQIRIADKLDSVLAKVDAAQARLEKILTLLKRFRQSVLAVATSGELTREWRESCVEQLENLFISDAIEIYDGNDLEPLPSNWCYLPFHKAADIRSNLVDPKLTPEAIHLAPNHVEPNTGKILELVTVQEDDVKSGKHKFFSGQIIYSKIRPYLNKVCLVDFEGLCSADMYPVDAKINAKFLLYYMLSDQFVTWTSQQQGRVVLPKINQNALNKIPVPTPSIKEQTEIVRRVESLFAQADAVEKQYLAAKQRLDRLSQSLLAKAFRGELVPQDPNDEPAAELLKRIQAERQQEADKPKRKIGKRDNQTNTVPNQTKINTMQLKDAPETYLLDILAQLGGESHAEVLWKKSELAIDDFYAKLKQEMLSNHIVEDKNSPDPALRKLKVANR